ncbi:MAG: 50S ribosomal protein L6, partial [Candidatus Magasanikbacteria bacterium]|nr:50S ribosomal protein L6 [Candidatus Magasanikbacteria bacterium]
MKFINMSRLGKLPISLPAGTEAKIENNFVIVKGPKGELKQEFNDVVKVEMVDGQIIVSIKDKDSKKEKAYWGLYRSLFNNMVLGVSQGFEKKLEINGVGFRVAIAGQKLT